MTANLSVGLQGGWYDKQWGRVIERCTRRDLVLAANTAQCLYVKAMHCSSFGHPFIIYVEDPTIGSGQPVKLKP